eukprot:jgi/Bigna1/83569/fgenesh1_pg.110_\
MSNWTTSNRKRRRSSSVADADEVEQVVQFSNAQKLAYHAILCGIASKKKSLVTRLVESVSSWWSGGSSAPPTKKARTRVETAAEELSGTSTGSTTGMQEDRKSLDGDDAEKVYGIMQAINRGRVKGFTREEINMYIRMMRENMREDDRPPPSRPQSRTTRTPIRARTASRAQAQRRMAVANTSYSLGAYGPRGSTRTTTATTPLSRSRWRERGVISAHTSPYSRQYDASSARLSAARQPPLSTSRTSEEIRQTLNRMSSPLIRMRTPMRFAFQAGLQARRRTPIRRDKHRSIRFSQSEAAAVAAKPPSSPNETNDGEETAHGSHGYTYTPPPPPSTQHTEQAVGDGPTPSSSYRAIQSDDRKKNRRKRSSPYNNNDNTASASAKKKQESMAFVVPDGSEDAEDDDEHYPSSSDPFSSSSKRSAKKSRRTAAGTPPAATFNDSEKQQQIDGGAEGEQPKDGFAQHGSSFEKWPATSEDKSNGLADFPPSTGDPFTAALGGEDAATNNTAESGKSDDGFGILGADGGASSKEAAAAADEKKDDAASSFELSSSSSSSKDGKEDSKEEAAWPATTVGFGAEGGAATAKDDGGDFSGFSFAPEKTDEHGEQNDGGFGGFGGLESEGNEAPEGGGDGGDSGSKPKICPGCQHPDDGSMDHSSCVEDAAADDATTSKDEEGGGGGGEAAAAEQTATFAGFGGSAADDGAGGGGDSGFGFGPIDSNESSSKGESGGDDAFSGGDPPGFGFGGGGDSLEAASKRTYESLKAD